MKKTLLIIMLLIQVTYAETYAQSSVSADPGMGLMDITDFSGTSLNANTLGMNVPTKLKIPVYNFSQDKDLPAGSGKIIISLGNKMMINPGFNLSTAPLSNYFNWTSTVINGETIITGDLIADFPADIYTETSFDIKGSNSCTSVIAASFKVTNHNTTMMLSDEDASNNDVSLQYTIKSLVANGDAGTVSVNSNSGGIAVMNILLNDLADCTSANLLNVRINTISSTHPGVSLNITNVEVAAGTPTGTYSLVYRICDITNSNACTEAVISVNVINTDVILAVTPFPNPYTDVINLKILSPVSGKATLVLYDMQGRRLSVLPISGLEAGVEKIVTCKIPAQRMSMVYKLMMSNQTIEGKLIPAY